MHDMASSGRPVRARIKNMRPLYLNWEVRVL
jgi:hypothetical protein